MALTCSSFLLISLLKARSVNSLLISLLIYYIKMSVFFFLFYSLLLSDLIYIRWLQLLPYTYNAKISISSFTSNELQSHFCISSSLKIPPGILNLIC